MPLTVNPVSEFDGLNKDLMKYFTLFALLVFTINLPAQVQERRPGSVSTPRYIVVDSKDNVFVTLKYGILKITPDGTVTNITKQAGIMGPLDKIWRNLIIDSKDNLYANDGKLIYKITVSADNRAVAKIHAGQEWSYKLEDGPIATAGFNTIHLMTIDRNDNIYIADSFDKIKDAVGGNFVTDPYYATVPAKIKGAPNYRVIRKLDPSGNITTLKTPNGKYIAPNGVAGMAVDRDGNIIYSSFDRFVAKIDVTTGSFTTVAGQPYKREYCPVYTQGEIAKAELVNPENIIINKKDEIIFADQRIHRVIRISGGKVSTLAGNNLIQPCSANIGGRAEEGNQDGKALTALFHFPKGIAYDSKGNLFIADMSNHAIRKLSPDGTVTTFAK